MTLRHEINRYLALRRSLGFKLRDAEYRLVGYAAYAAERHETHVRTETLTAWAKAGKTSNARADRFRDVARFARHAHAEDPKHEVPVRSPFRYRKVRRPPCIFSDEEIRRIVETAARLKKRFPLRPLVFSTLFGLLAATGLRVSEALKLRTGDLRPDGILHIREAKGRKDRFVPLHTTTEAALQRYLRARKKVATEHDHVFTSETGQRLPYNTARGIFRKVAREVGLDRDGARRPRLNDLRHTFATRALERWAGKRGGVEQHVVSLASYLGHVGIRETYWYLEATPQLMQRMATASAALLHGRSA